MISSLFQYEVGSLDVFCALIVLDVGARRSPSPLRQRGRGEQAADVSTVTTVVLYSDVLCNFVWFDIVSGYIIVFASNDPGFSNLCSHVEPFEGIRRVKKPQGVFRILSKDSQTRNCPQNLLANCKSQLGAGWPWGSQGLLY